jgi:hypothetical protein
VTPALCSRLYRCAWGGDRSRGDRSRSPHYIHVSHCSMRLSPYNTGTHPPLLLAGSHQLHSGAGAWQAGHCPHPLGRACGRTRQPLPHSLAGTERCKACTGQVLQSGLRVSAPRQCYSVCRTSHGRWLSCNMVGLWQKCLEKGPNLVCMWAPPTPTSRNCNEPYPHVFHPHPLLSTATHTGSSRLTGMCWQYWTQHSLTHASGM